MQNFDMAAVTAVTIDVALESEDKKKCSELMNCEVN